MRIRLFFLWKKNIPSRTILGNLLENINFSSTLSQHLSAQVGHPAILHSEKQLFPPPLSAPVKNILFNVTNWTWSGVFGQDTSCTHLFSQINHRAGLFQCLLCSQGVATELMLLNTQTHQLHRWWVRKGAEILCQTVFLCKGIPSFWKEFINLNKCHWLQPWQTTKSKSTMNSLIVKFNRISAKGKSSFCAVNIQGHSPLLVS